jgi:hypothetical protein
MNRALLAFNPEAEGSGGDALLFGVASPDVGRATALTALEELDLASSFLEVPPGSRMAAFLRHLVSRSAHCGGSAADPAVMRALHRRLVRSGSAVHAALGDAPARQVPSPETLFGTELEGLSPEDREFETARRFVRFAVEASRLIACVPSGAAPERIAAHAERLAGRRLAPGLVPGASNRVGMSPAGFRARRRLQPAS